MNKNVLIGVVLLVVIGVGAYMFTNKPADVQVVNESPIISPGENTTPGNPDQNLTIEPAAAAARKDLAAKLAVEEKSIVILQITDTTWTDGCLGLGGPAESCLQALVPGFKVEMTAKGKTYLYRTDKTGISVRAETK